MEEKSDKSLQFQCFISQFYSKSLQIIVDSRVPSLDRTINKKIDKCFGLFLCDPPAYLGSINYRRINLTDPMVIDIVLVHKGTYPPKRTVLERWTVQYDCPSQGFSNGIKSCDCSKLNEYSISILRLLYSHVKFLPAHRIFRWLSRKKSSESFDFHVTYEVSSYKGLFSRGEEEMMEEYNFISGDDLQGRLGINVIYRTSLVDLNLGLLTPLLKDSYINVGALCLSSSREKKGVCDNYFPFREPRHVPSLAHSSYIEVLKGSRNFSHDFPCYTTNSLPILSTRSTKDDRPLKTIEAHRDGDVHSKTKNSSVQKNVIDNKSDSGRFSGFSSLRSSRRFGISRSSCKSSFMNDSNDWDFSCPFEVDMLGVHHSQAGDDKNTSEITSKAQPMVNKSQDAAIGVLVSMLRAAPPLHYEDQICVPSQSLKTKTKELINPASGVPMLKKTADALEELRSYIKIRDLLLSKRDISLKKKPDWWFDEQHEA